MRVQPTFTLWLTPDAQHDPAARRAERDADASGTRPPTREPVSDVEANFATAARPGATSFQVDPMLDWLKP